jgi:hypothetical protein
LYLLHVFDDWVMMYFIILLMDMLSNCLWMIAFHNCYYMQLFFSRIPVFSLALRPTKTWTYFRRPCWPTKIELFSSPTDVKPLIFVYFIPSA